MSLRKRLLFGPAERISPQIRSRLKRIRLKPIATPLRNASLRFKSVSVLFFLLRAAAVLGRANTTPMLRIVAKA